MISRRSFCALAPAAAAQAQGAANLDLRVSAPARVYITGGDARPHLCTGGFTFERRRETHSVIESRGTASLPPGRYTVRAERGAEYVPVEKTIEVPAAGSVRVDLDVPLFLDMNARGWYSGDLHLHRTPAEMALAVRAEHLNVAPVITRHVGGSRVEPPPFPQANLAPADARHIVTLQNQEVERLRIGHGAVLLLNMPDPFEYDLAPLWPVDIDFCRRTRRRGGFIDGEKPIWKNVPVNAAFGLLDSIGVVNNHFHPRDMLLDAENYGAMDRGDDRYRTPQGFAAWMMDLYYRLLNCGFRLPVSAGSASGIMPSWPGYERLYVRLDSEFSVAEWFRGLKSGRSVATNGPLLIVALDGKPPGYEVAWQPRQRARLEIEVRAQAPLERVEVVYNGSVLLSLPVRGRELHQRLDVVPPAAGWLAVRCFESAAGTARFAHSSPFYFTHRGTVPVVKSDALYWADTVTAIARSVRSADYPSPAVYEQAQSIFRDAAEVYRKLAGAVLAFPTR